MSALELNALLLALAPYIVPPLVAGLVYVVNGAIAKTPVNVRSVVADVAHTAVAATEMTASSQLNGAGKKQVATELIEKQLSTMGVKVDNATISALIEQAVLALKANPITLNPTVPAAVGVSLPATPVVSAPVSDQPVVQAQAQS
jgi:LL-H family phage holin